MRFRPQPFSLLHEKPAHVLLILPCAVFTLRFALTMSPFLAVDYDLKFRRSSQLLLKRQHPACKLAADHAFLLTVRSHVLIGQTLATFPLKAWRSWRQIFLEFL